MMLLSERACVDMAPTKILSSRNTLLLCTHLITHVDSITSDNSAHK